MVKDDHGPLRERQRTRRVSDRFDVQVTLGLDSSLAGRDGGAWQKLYGGGGAALR